MQIIRAVFSASDRILRNGSHRMVFSQSEFENQEFLYTLLFSIYEFVPVYGIFTVYRQRTSPYLGEICKGLSSVINQWSHFDNLTVSKKGPAIFGS